MNKGFRIVILLAAALLCGIICAAAVPVTATDIPEITPMPTDIPAIATAVPTQEPTPEPTPAVTDPPAGTLPLSGVIIGIDPGHQARANLDREPIAPGSGETKYKVSGGTQGVVTKVPEYEVVLKIGLLLRTALEAQGAEVYMTRETNDVDISNIERAQMMNEAGAHVVLRLHLNGGMSESTRGIGAFVKSKGSGAEESYAIAETLLAALGETTGARIEQIQVYDTYTGLNWSEVPSILLEMGYMSNPDEDRLLNTEEYQALLVEGIVRGLTGYFDEHPVDAAGYDPTLYLGE